MSDIKSNLDISSDEFTEKFTGHISRFGQDNTLVILKAHLLSEELMYKHLSVKLPHPEYLAGGRFTYSQTIRLSRAVCGDERHDKWVWGALSKLNKIRNRYGHNLEPTGVEKEIDELLQLINAHASSSFSEAQMGELPRAMLMLLVGLYTVLSIENMKYA